MLDDAIYVGLLDDYDATVEAISDATNGDPDHNGVKNRLSLTELYSASFDDQLNQQATYTYQNSAGEDVDVKLTITQNDIDARELLIADLEQNKIDLADQITARKEAIDAQWDAMEANSDVPYILEAESQGTLTPIVDATEGSMEEWVKMADPLSFLKIQDRMTHLFMMRSLFMMFEQAIYDQKQNQLSHQQKPHLDFLHLQKRCRNTWC